MTSVTDRREHGPLRVLVLARSFPNDLLPNMGLWTARPMGALAARCDVRVISPVPYCPPLPDLGPLRQYTRFRRIPRTATWGGMPVVHPRFPVGLGNSLYALEPYAYHLGVRGSARRAWRERPFDVVHASFIYPDGVVAHRLSERYGVPFVVTELAPWTGWLDRRSVRRLALPAARAASSILALSSHVEQTIRRYAGEDVTVRIVPPPVDGEEFPLGNPAHRKRDQILFVGFVNFNKGVDVLLRAVAALAARGEPGRLVVIGGAHYRNTRRQELELHRLAQSLGLGERARFVGKQPPQEVARMMGESAVVVLPSRAEAFGAVLAEALACGTPVVASRSGGPEDVVADEVGLLVPVGDHEALADAISAVLRRPESYRPEQLREYALSRFGLPSVSERIYDAYVAALRAAPMPRWAPEPRASEAA
jgi:teichuronic acid biosynthesis glycosyltransferase TuaC